MPTKTSAAARRWLVKVGINYPSKPGGPEVRAEPGDIVADIPKGSLVWLLNQGVIEEVD